MIFEKKVFDDDDFSRERKEYEMEKTWFLVENGPFDLVAILYMNHEQREQLFEWILSAPETRSPLFIEGCGSSQDDYNKTNQKIFEEIFQQHVLEGDSNGKRRNGSAKKRRDSSK